MGFESGRMPIEEWREKEMQRLEEKIAELEPLSHFERTDPELATELRELKQKLAQLRLEQGQS